MEREERVGAAAAKAKREATEMEVEKYMLMWRS